MAGTGPLWPHQSHPCLTVQVHDQQSGRVHRREGALLHRWGSCPIGTLDQRPSAAGDKTCHVMEGVSLQTSTHSEPPAVLHARVHSPPQHQQIWHQPHGCCYRPISLG